MKKITLFLILIAAVSFGGGFEFALNFSYLANDTIPCDSTINKMSGSDSLDYLMVADSLDTTMYGYYIKFWARKIKNDGSEPESSSIEVTSYSDTFYTVYHVPNYFTVFIPYPTYLSLNLPVENLRCIDGDTPFGFDLYDSLYFYAEDRFGRYSDSFYCDGKYAGSKQYMYFTAAFDTALGASTIEMRGPLADSCWSVYPFLLKYHGN